ncbi:MULTISPECIES: hypothetical protein [unclassified Anabaena]|uniref:hypothetical protein n=1 Tax=unclassified Anabaena TaxID=2619674 RepID=UPI002B1F323C|nr:hypothetical protein [Anabaena sp. UHCC 0399]MEA5568222.1 hypothetical protein [Anabaena sp. UHCC 0399]
MINLFSNPIKLATITLIAGTSLSLTSLPASANNTRVYVKNSSCVTYNNSGKVVGTVNRGYYPLNRIYKGRDGRNYARIYADFRRSGQGLGYVNIPTSCLNHNGRYVIEY